MEFKEETVFDRETGMFRTTVLLRGAYATTTTICPPSPTQIDALKFKVLEYLENKKNEQG